MESQRLAETGVHVTALITTILPLLFVLSGAAGLIYEVVWARELVLVFGNTSQAVSAILTGFFAGLAVAVRWPAVVRRSGSRRC